MKTVLFTIAVVGLCWSCSKTTEPSVDGKSALLGKWEAEYQVRLNDTTYYGVAENPECAYALLEFDYSSGYELQTESKANLIYCGQNKEQNFTWGYKDNTLVFNENGKAYNFKVSDQTNDNMTIYSEQKGFTYYMKKF